MSRSRNFNIITIGLAAGMFSLAAPSFAQEERAPAPDFSDEVPEAAPEEPQEISPENQVVLDQMAAVIDALDGEAERTGNNWQITVDETMILIVTDPNAGRMRIITPIADATALPEAAFERLMQANFDTALDARYAIGQGAVWGAFVHPLGTLNQRDFASGILQVKSLADTFGTTFSSGALNYGGGDSGAIIEDQLEQLLEQLEEQQAPTV